MYGITTRVAYHFENTLLKTISVSHSTYHFTPNHPKQDHALHSDHQAKRYAHTFNQFKERRHFLPQFSLVFNGEFD